MNAGRVSDVLRPDKTLDRNDRYDFEGLENQIGLPYTSDRI